jgi:predicted transcriptional regulator of viral defense system
VRRDAIDRILAIAAHQDSLITVEQAKTVGVSPTMLLAAVKRGWLYRQRLGVYVVAGARPSPWRAVRAAFLVAGTGAVVSHTTAAALHRFHGVISDGIEITVPYPARRALDGVRIHHSKTLRDVDQQNLNGLRVTTPVRSLIDVAERFHDPLLGSIVDEGAIARLWTAESVSARLGDVRRGVTGATELRRVLAQRLGEGNPDSRLEQRVVRMVKRWTRGYTLHYRIVLDGVVIEMDIAWVTEKVDGEVDGMRTRVVSRTKFERERRRANILAAHGWRIVHFTDKMDEATIFAQLAPLLGLRNAGVGAAQRSGSQVLRSGR